MALEHVNILNQLHPSELTFDPEPLVPNSTNIIWYEVVVPLLESLIQFAFCGPWGEGLGGGFDAKSEVKSRFSML